MLSDLGMKAVDIRWDSRRQALAFTAVDGEEHQCRITFDALQALGGTTSSDATSLIPAFLYNEKSILAVVRQKLESARGGIVELVPADFPLD